MSEQGYICMHRQVIDHWIFKNPQWFKLWFYLIAKAAHADRKQLVGAQLVELKRGQLVYGRISFASKLGLSEQVLRTVLNRLKSDGNITIETTSAYSVITIINYDTYNPLPESNNQQDNQRVTSEQPARNHKQTLIIKEDINLNLESLDIAPTSKIEVAAKPTKPKPIWNQESNRIDGLTPAHIESFKRAFPAIDVAGEITKLESYYLGRPDVTRQAKTNWLARINTWLGNAERFRQRDADRAANRQSLYGQPLPQPEIDYEKRMRELKGERNER